MSDTEICLNWDAVSYRIYRDTGSGTPILIATTTHNSYEDKSLTAGTNYCYRIKKVDSSGRVSDLAPEGNRVCAASAEAGPQPPTLSASALSDDEI